MLNLLGIQKQNASQKNITMNIVITGASRGIGFELAKEFASLGANNIVAISRDESKLKELKSACIRENVEAHLYPLVLDVTTLKTSDNILANRIKEHFQEIDIVINNAGYLVNKPFEKIEEQEVTQTISTNFTSVISVTQQLIPMLKEGSHVVNISSMGGVQGSQKFPGLSVYSASKAALAVLTECLAEELKHTGIAFNCLALGAVNTEMLNDAFPDYKAPVSASEMARFIAQFALTGQKMFNGKILPVSTSTP